MRFSSLRPLALCAALLLAACGEEGRYGATLVTTGTHTVHRGETLHGMLVVAGGQTVLHRDAHVTGTVYVLGGTLEVAGAIGGDLSVVGGEVRLAPTAEVAGDLTVGTGTLERSPTARIGGEVATSVGGQVPGAAAAQSASIAERISKWLLQALGLAALAALAARFLPRPTARVGEAMLRYPIVSGAMGMLAGVVGLSLLVLMAFTVVLIPVALLGVLAGAAAIACGWIALGAEVGGRLARRQGWALAPTTGAFVGTLLVVAALEGLRALPGVGGSLVLIAATVGLGAMLLTRFGTRVFVPDTIEVDDPPLLPERRVTAVSS